MKSFTAKTLCLFVALFVPSTLPSFAQYSNDKTGLIDSIKDYSVNHFWESKVVDKCMTNNFSPSCWAKLMSDRDWGLGSVIRVSRYMNQFMMNNKGSQDLEAIEAANNSDRPNNQGRVDTLIADMPTAVTFTLQADGIKCDSTEWDLTHRFIGDCGRSVSRPSFQAQRRRSVGNYDHESKSEGFDGYGKC